MADYEKKRIYELADSQTTIVDTDLGVLDKSGYTKAKKFTMLNLYNYLKIKFDLIYQPKVAYLEYVALIPQTGTGAPVQTVLQNDFGSSFVASRNDAGMYVFTNAGVFTDKRVIIETAPPYVTILGANTYNYTAFYIDDDSFGVNSWSSPTSIDTSGASADIVTLADDMLLENYSFVIVRAYDI